MAVELTLSLMSHNEGSLARLDSHLGPLRRESDIGVRLREIDYDTGWAEFVRTAIHGGNLHVSEMGSTWINDFAAMNALRPFTPTEIHSLGGAEAFPPGLWRAGVGERGTVWAVPWMTDLSLVYYRRDLFRKAGVDETDAFSSAGRFAETLAALARGGIEQPWAAPTKYSHVTVHNLAMWLWSVGAAFVSASGKQVTLNQPDARRALISYFDLHRYLGPERARLEEWGSDRVFARGGAAVAISGPWLLPFCEPAIAKDVGLATPLKHAYLGGSSLVIWASCRDPESAFRMVSWLLGRDVQDAFPGQAGMLPARLEVLEHVPFAGSEELNAVVLAALKGGQSLPLAPLWGMIEDRLARVFEDVWDSLIPEPEADLERLLNERLTPEVNRLNTILSQ